jgi:hypothetical protein
MYQWRGNGLGDLVSSIAAAITQMENANPANNNPGNLTTLGPNGTYVIATYPDLATGELMLDNQIQTNINRGLNLQQFFGGEPGVYPGYAPAPSAACGAGCKGNNPTNYANFVAGQIGADTSTPLSQLQAGADGASSDLSSVVADVSGDSTDTSGLDLSDSSGGLSTTVMIALAAAAVGLVVWAAA